MSHQPDSERTALPPVGEGPGVAAQAVAPLPSLAESVAYVRELGKPTAAEVLGEARARGRVALQPRCGVGSHVQMTTLLQDLERHGNPDILSLTIDSHTRLKRFDKAEAALRRNPADLNGYPLVTHGWQRGRQLNESVGVPLEIRHGSPDARLLFETAVASGITSFEGGGISYNLPYSKAVPLSESLAAWRDVDRRCGELAELGLVIDRELFGTLTAVLVPPSISLAISVLEAVAAAREGVRCISVAYPQGGHCEQDVAALRTVPELAARYLPEGTEVHAVLHEYMGPFPKDRGDAEDLILYGALVARLGGATKLITKTYQEAYGIPDTRANIDGLVLAARANSPLLSCLRLDEDRIAEEREWILREVAEIVEPVLAAPELLPAIVESFASGRLDIPFSASRYALSEVIPRRAPDGAIRYQATGGLPLSDTLKRRNEQALATGGGEELGEMVRGLTADINYFLTAFDTPGAPR
ncbi:methylaspartate mutase [Streptomyces physcomitrii]|uniref:Methylaspartate mutase n=1 Tax=Streptomyces physcomitrii TaxID=2724184 RepID=A0ABX1HAE4_9ACTN|nr:methylaspartate mutase [Streptomyces physcomitrii]NKI44275.1 methylaspartate mutase [Streptomyces physcomitrii]